MPPLRLLVFLAASLTAVAGRAAPPNIVVVLADQWRAQAFGFAGDPNVKTPNFDRLAGESVRFLHAVAGMPVCSPVRASLLTGQRPLTHGVFLNDVPLDPAAVTLPKVLKAAGDAFLPGPEYIRQRGYRTDANGTVPYTN